MVNALKMSIALVGVIVLLLCIFWLPKMAKISAEMFPEVSYLKYPVLFGIYFTCIPFYIGIFHTFKLLKLIDKKNAFTKEACKSLRVIVFSAIGVIVFYTAGIIYLNKEAALPPGLGLVGIAIIFASFVIAVFASVLKELLMKVIEIKNENDLTI
jgi:predicted MFS family arabinose efflux permease